MNWYSKVRAKLNTVHIQQTPCLWYMWTFVPAGGCTLRGNKSLTISVYLVLINVYDGSTISAVNLKCTAPWSIALHWPGKWSSLDTREKLWTWWSGAQEKMLLPYLGALKFTMCTNVWPEVFKIYPNKDFAILKGKKTPLRHEKKKPCFTGGRTIQVGSVGRDIFLLFFPFWWQKWLP